MCSIQIILVLRSIQTVLALKSLQTALALQYYGENKLYLQYSITEHKNVLAIHHYREV